MLDIKVSSLIQIADGINVSGFELKVDLKIVKPNSAFPEAPISAYSVKPESFW